MWTDETTKSYDNFSITDNDTLWNFICDYSLRFYNAYSTAKFIDLCAGNGKFSKIMYDKYKIDVTSIDKYSQTPNVINCDCMEYLQENRSKVITCIGGVHFFDKEVFIENVEKSLVEGGTLILLSCSRSSDLFGNKEFNELFFSKGFEKNVSLLSNNDIYESIEIKVKIDKSKMVNFISNKPWSSLALMDELTISKMISLVPGSLEELSLKFDIRIYQKKGDILVCFKE